METKKILRLSIIALIVGQLLMIFAYIVKCRGLEYIDRLRNTISIEDIGIHILYTVISTITILWILLLFNYEP